MKPRRRLVDAEAVRALSIRQPFAELILRGIKTIEYRSRPTRIIRERFWIYASRGGTKGIWSRDLSVENPPEWMIELAEQVGMIEPGAGALLPTGVIVGSAVIERCSPLPLTTNNPQLTTYGWHLADIRRARKLRKPTRHPQPAWFNPFD